MASKRAHRRRSCECKVRYDSPTDPKILAEVHRLRISGSSRTHIYPCKFCKGYHIGRRNQQQQQSYQRSIGYAA